jgi:2'-5' RNA ligase
VVIQAPTYIVLDLPAATAAQVHAIRKRYDPKTARLPVEITVAGSSGLGTVSPTQETEHVFAIVEKVGRRLLPFATSFIGVSQFAGTSVYWLALRDRSPFDALQSGFLDAGLRFEASPFSYTPHCTLSASASITADQRERLLNEDYPSEEFRLVRLSLYQRVDEGIALIWAFSFDES